MTPFALKKVNREMKALLVLALSSLCATAALADEAPTELAGQNAPIVEDYTYSTHLDVAKVVSMSNIPEVCEVVPAKMEYEDSQGQRHILNYHVMGNGCSNG
ncbi:Type IIA topoisomerase (DNA gyrase/topo II, topoisomerase IV), A subunit [Pseudomonas sp. R2-37-08W]|nr:Type IIA topoisomerase (DNA gyrase/topo II, topoisomerase IV), A subunit [Pseudomonas sp. R2-37-08W]AZF17482.1 Type IIA topoisomerase (DNA gyrase/topo II, topoisomerase IV), A subunit [Pseudomonas sp. R3-18-08]AZF22922.1 Type IIA topoisomerase (DNA gyrase/topo II, topoisomerase IV), A subunit [Pseudomonas sp. R3-52-08]AZF28197.1 Type IIA topoisomerase (DNA gyrase/topo II, topoisomerase IV), A subunit [Pseudomonas sp. R2-60-08W]AZF38884.1 Type IIA topoisomerase (DNA gyrase/topo II, topoisomer